VGRGDVVVGLRLVVYKVKGGPRQFFCFRWRGEKTKAGAKGSVFAFAPTTDLSIL
jgi:hypothetical protein